MTLLGRLLCAVGLHNCKGTSVPHTYACRRPGCSFITGGHV